MSPPPRSPAPRMVIIGIGNPDRGDDGVGQVVAQRLHQELVGCAHVRVVQHSGDGTQLLNAWQDADLAIVVDAVQSGAPPGTVHRLDAHQPPLPAASWRCSTHAFGVAEALALARVLQQLPPQLILYGIEGHTFTPGAGLSAAGARSVPAVVARIRQDIDDFQAARHPLRQSLASGS